MSFFISRGYLKLEGSCAAPYLATVYNGYLAAKWTKGMFCIVATTSTFVAILLR